MSNKQRQSGKKRFRSDGTSIWSRRYIDGPGVWISCIKGKERQAIGETYDLFESLAEELWPTSQDLDEDNEDAEEEEDLEKAVLKEVEKMKKPRKEKLFSSCQTGAPCLIFMSCKPPVDPVALVELHMKKVEETGITHTRATNRFSPVTNSCDANLAEIASLCKRVVLPSFESEESKTYRYRIEIRTRNHKTVTRDEIIKTIADRIPKTHTVDLENPELFILVEVFKATCGISVVRDYYRYKKFNAVEVSQASLTKAEEGALQTHSDSM